MDTTANTPVIAWPSLTDLAGLLGISLSNLSRFSGVRTHQTRRVGKEVKIAPLDAVAILVERGLTEEIAMTSVLHVIEKRRERVPALCASDLAANPAVSGVSLRRSTFRPSQEASLVRFHLFPARSQTMLSRDEILARFEALDRRTKGSDAPLESYIYDRQATSFDRAAGD